VNLFTYGSLMYSKVWESIVTGRYRSSSAELRGYTRRCVVGEDYPVIIPGSDSELVTGTLYFDLSEADIAVLDKFEGEPYIRTALTVDLGRQTAAAEAYLLNPSNSQIVSEDSWDQMAFEQQGLNRFIESYRGFMRTT